MTDTPAKKRISGRQMVGLAAVVLIVVVAIGYWPVSAAYHFHQLKHWQVIKDAEQRRYHELCSKGFFHSPSNTKALRNYYYHLKRLMELGAVQLRDYHLSHFTTGTAEYEHMVRAVRARPSVATTVYLPPPPGGGSHWLPAPLAIEVYTTPLDAVAWDRFIAERDVPDYRKRFMGIEEEEK